MQVNKLYPTNQTVSYTDIELTKIISEIDNPLSNIAEPYYMGYIHYENFPHHFNLNTVEIPEDGSSITFSPVEENHSWGYIKQAGAGSYFRGIPQLYAYKSDDSIYEYNTTSNAHCRFINQIKMAGVNTANNFQIDICGIIIKDTYLEEIQTANGSFSFYHHNNSNASSFTKTVRFTINDFVEIYNNREKFSFTITWNSVDYIIEFNGADYINDTVAKVSLVGGLTAYLSIFCFTFDGRSDYRTSLGSSTTMTITPFFSQTIPKDHEATDIVSQENAVWVPHNVDIGDSRFRYNYRVSTFSNVGSLGVVAGMIPGNFPIGTLTMNEFEAAGFRENYDGMIEETMFLTGTGSVDWGSEHYYDYRYYSQIGLEDILREITIYNKYNENNVSPITTYTDDFKTSLFNNNDEPSRETINGNYPQDEAFVNALRPWQIPDADITVNTYYPKDAFSTLNDINYLKDNPKEKESLWNKLLEYLNEDLNNADSENMITNEDGGEEGSLFNTIQENIDLPDTVGSNKGFFDEIYQNLVSTLKDDYSNVLLKNDWEYIKLSEVKDAFWNISMTETIIDYGINFDFSLRDYYYSNFLFEDENGVLKEYSNYNGVGISDAGNSFDSEEKMYDIGYNLTFSYYKDSNGKKIYFKPFTFIITSEETIKKNSEHYFDLFSWNGGPKHPKFLRMLNDEIPDKWRWRDIKGAVRNSNMDILSFSSEWSSWQEFESFIDSLFSNWDTPLFGKGEQTRKVYGRILYPWVSPWSNYAGNTYSFVRKDDIKRSVMKLGANEKEENNKKVKVDQYFLNFTKVHNGKLNRLLMPQNKRKVEIEDLNRNFWVIGQTISGISRDILDKNGIYPQLFNKILNEIMQLWENVIFLWSEIAIQSKKWPAVHSEIVYITFDDLRDFFNYDQNFSEEELENLKFEEDAPYGDWKISRLKWSIGLEQTVVKFLRQYRLKYANYNVSLYPILRLDNYQKEFYSREIILGEYKYCHNYDQMELEVVDPEDESITNPPRGIYKDIDGEPVFFTTLSNSTIGLSKRAGQMDYHHCQFKESFFSYSQAKVFDGNFKNYYIADVDAKNFSKWTYGIVEKMDGENYSGCFPVSKANEMKTENGERAYSLFIFDPFLFKTSMLNNIKEGIWTTTFTFYYHDLGEVLIYQSVQKSNICHAHYNYKNSDSVNFSDSRQGEHDDAPFIQFDLANNELGYFKGELLTYKYSTTETNDFKVVDLKKVLLRPSSYNDNKYYYYGTNNANATIQADTKSDKYALTNYLTNVYDNWACSPDNKIPFWVSRTNKINLPDNETWSEDYSEIIGYIGGVAQKKSRTEVSQSQDNEQKVWNSLEEDWRPATIEALDIDFSETPPLTIFFVEGERYINFNSKRGIAQTGEDIIATDGLLHHEWPSTSRKVLSGAAARIPTKKSGVSYSFYSKHTEPTIANENLWNHYRKLKDFTIDRMGDRVVEETSIMSTISYQPQKLSGSNEDFRTLTLRTQNGDNYNWLIQPNSYTSSDSIDIYGVLRKEGDQTFTEDNWLIKHNCYTQANNIQYFIPDKKEDLNGCEYNLRGYDTPRQYRAGSLEGKVSSVVGKENILKALDDERYYKQIYQRYIYYQWVISAEGQDKVDKYLYDNNITIEKILYDNTNDYYLNLNQILFGWIRIIIDGHTYTAKFHVDTPLKYFYLSSNEIDFIEREIRNNDNEGSINKIFTGENGIENIKYFIKLINKIAVSSRYKYWENDDNPGSNVDLSNAICYGNISTHFGVNISGDDSEEVQRNIWLEDRIMLAQFESLQLADQEMLYNAKDDIWPNTDIVNAMSSHEELWYDEDENLQLQKIEKLIRPLEGQLSTPITLSLEQENYTIGDKFYLGSSIIETVQDYTFGPNNGYARRSRYRYSDYSENDDAIKDIIGENQNQWPIEPEQPTSSSGSDILWRDDYDITNTTVNQMIQGYETIQVIDSVELNDIPDDILFHLNEEEGGE